MNRTVDWFLEGFITVVWLSSEYDCTTIIIYLHIRPNWNKAYINIKKKTSEVFEFSIVPYTRNRTLGNLRKYSFTSNFDSSFNLRCKNAKNRKSRYASRRKKKISEISKFSILPYTQNGKLGNLCKCSFQILTVVLI